MHTSSILFRILYAGIAFALLLPIVSTYREAHYIPALLGCTFVMWVFLPLTLWLHDRLNNHSLLNRVTEAWFMITIFLPVICILISVLKLFT